MEFCLAIGGANIGMGHVWRFPYLLYYCGVKFLLPYMVCLIFLGMPMFFPETAVGQYTREGPFTAWRKICPMFQGIGIAAELMVIYQTVSHSLVLAGALFYLYNSFANPLPWSHCNNVWNSVLYFTVAFPSLLMVILFFRGATVPGAWEGIWRLVFRPLSSFSLVDVWRFAMNDVFHSYVVGQGVLTTIGSYNRYKHDSYNDCLVLCSLHTGASLFSSLVFFLLVGFGSHSYNMTVSGWELYVIMTRALSLLPVPQFWCALFFIMIFLFTFNCQLLLVESLVTTIMDVFPEELRKPWRREALVLLTVSACFLFGLPLVTKEGFKLINIIGGFCLSGLCMLYIICFEVIIIGWIYGVTRFCDNIEDMIGYQPYPYPLYTIVIIVTVVKSAFPSWGTHIGAPLMLAPILSVPIFVLFSVSKHDDLVTTPARELKQARPGRPRLSLCKRAVLAGREANGKRTGEEELTADSTTGV